MNTNSFREHFPLLSRNKERPYVYVDNAATTLKPISVINAMQELYRDYPFNVHRGAYQLAERTSLAFEHARKLVRSFLNARSTKEIIFTKGTTESINLVSHSFGERFIRPGDEILITHMEHHANIVPWVLLCKRTGAVLRVVPMRADGVLEFGRFLSLLTPKTKLVGMVHVSNSLGTVNPIHKVIEAAHVVGAKVLVDAAQSIAHFPLDVKSLDADFVTFSGHKMYGPFGIGVLYGKQRLLEEMPPFLGGGGMIKNVSFTSISYADLPNKFEAGTPPVSAAVGLGAAIEFIRSVGFDTIQQRERELTKHALDALQGVPGLHIYGQSPQRTGVFSFNLDGVHAHDLSTFLDQKGVAIRSGHHCNQPVMEYYKVPATNRMSLAFYNEIAEIDYIVDVLNQARRFFS